MQALRRAILVPVGLYASWLGMMAVHELGHVLHAKASGGVVERVTIPLAGYSLTTFSVNPRPHFVAWGGPAWGCVIPLMLLAVLVFTPAPRPIRNASQFFAGFCLVANGVYLGVGWTSRAGDAGDLLRHGTPVWALVTFGACAVTIGMWLWHRLGSHARNVPPTPVSERTREDPDPGRAS